MAPTGDLQGGDRIPFQSSLLVDGTGETAGWNASIKQFPLTKSKTAGMQSIQPGTVSPVNQGSYRDATL
jgi:hypothetical protein